MSMETVYRLLYCVVKPFFCLCHPVRAVGRENVPDGGVVLCANHTALTDPLFVCFACTLRYQIRPMAKIELSRVPIIGPLLGKAGVIYVDRGHADMKAVKAALSWLKNQGKLLIFPEGTRSKGDEMHAFKMGSLQPAYMGKAAIVPVTLKHCYALDEKKSHIRSISVIYGKPIPYEEYGKIKQEELLTRLHDEIQRNVYAR